jgi:hypothetical protein
VPARVARAPNPDAVGINFRQKFEKGDSAPPIGDLAPWIDVVRIAPSLDPKFRWSCRSATNPASAKARAKRSSPCTPGNEAAGTGQNERPGQLDRGTREVAGRDDFDATLTRRFQVDHSIRLSCVNVSAKY